MTTQVGTMMMQHYFDVFLFYLMATLVPCTLVWRFIFLVSKFELADLPSLLNTKYAKIMSLLLAQTFITTLWLSYASWWLAAAFAVESAYFGLRGRRWFLEWLNSSGRI